MAPVSGARGESDFQKIISVSFNLLNNGHSVTVVTLVNILIADTPNSIKLSGPIVSDIQVLYNI